MRNVLLFFLGINVAFYSCSDSPNSDAAGTKLTKVATFDNTSVLDYEELYSYDAAGRVVNIYVNNTSHQLAKFFYDGSNIKPYKMNGENDESTHFFTFSTDGKLLVDSSVNIYNQFINVSRYSYPNSNAIVHLWEHQTISTGTWTIDGVDTASLDAQGRIVQCKKYRYTSPGGGYRLHEIENFSYDNKINPYYNLNIGFLNRFSGPIETVDYQFFQAGNCTEKQWINFDASGNPFPTETVRYICTYNSNNYLSSYTSQTLNPADSWKDVFIYE